MAEWPGNGDTDWNTKMLAYLAVGHATDGTHNQAGLTAQIVNFQTGAVNTGTVTIPKDDTIPQNTEGNEFLTLAITPKSATNKLKIDVNLMVSHTSGSAHFTTIALFQDSTANALAAVFDTPVTAANQGQIMQFSHYMTAGTTSATTFKVRVGADVAGTLTLNGASSGRFFGGVAASSITITEIWA
jgi:hypothetical protein